MPLGDRLTRPVAAALAVKNICCRSTNSRGWGVSAGWNCAMVRNGSTAPPLAASRNRTRGGRSALAPSYVSWSAKPQAAGWRRADAIPWTGARGSARGSRRLREVPVDFAQQPLKVEATLVDDRADVQLAQSQQPRAVEHPGHGDDGHVGEAGVGAEGFEERHAVHLRHEHVEQHEVDGVRLQRRDRLDTVRRARDRESLRLQQAGHRLANDRGVFNDQNPLHFTAPSRPHLLHRNIQFKLGCGNCFCRAGNLGQSETTLKTRRNAGEPPHTKTTKRFSHPDIARRNYVEGFGSQVHRLVVFVSWWFHFSFMSATIAAHVGPAETDASVLRLRRRRVAAEGGRKGRRRRKCRGAAERLRDARPRKARRDRK